jgi:hypothetical protein
VNAARFPVGKSRGYQSISQDAESPGLDHRTVSRAALIEVHGFRFHGDLKPSAP